MYSARKENCCILLERTGVFSWKEPVSAGKNCVFGFKRKTGEFGLKGERVQAYERRTRVIEGVILHNFFFLNRLFISGCKPVKLVLPTIPGWEILLDREFMKILPSPPRLKIVGPRNRSLSNFIQSIKKFTILIQIYHS